MPPLAFYRNRKNQFFWIGKKTVLVDTESTVSDSWEIAKYLETENPDSPSLTLDHGEVFFIKFWVETVLHP